MAEGSPKWLSNYQIKNRENTSTLQKSVQKLAKKLIINASLGECIQYHFGK